MERGLDSFLWWVIGITLALVLLGALIPELYGRAARKREKRLSHRPKRRIEL